MNQPSCSWPWGALCDHAHFCCYFQFDFIKAEINEFGKTFHDLIMSQYLSTKVVLIKLTFPPCCDHWQVLEPSANAKLKNENVRQENIWIQNCGSQEPGETVVCAPLLECNWCDTWLCICSLFVFVFFCICTCTCNCICIWWDAGV